MPSSVPYERERNRGKQLLAKAFLAGLRNPSLSQKRRDFSFHGKKCNCEDLPLNEIVLYYFFFPWKGIQGPRETFPWYERNSSLLSTVTRPEQGNITLVRKKQFVTFNHRRRIELEDKTEGHRACWGDRIIAAPAVLPSAGQIDQLSSTVFGAKQLARQ